MDSTNIFTVTPMSQDAELEAGQVYAGSISISNPSDATSDFPYKVEVSPYSVVGQEYTANLETLSNRSLITKWIKIDNPTGVVKPNETAEVTFTITVPETAPAGGQYAALMIRSSSGESVEDGFAINNVFEMASLIYANVAGETVHEGEVSELTIPEFVTSVPFATNAVIENNGNTHETAKIALRVKNFFTSEMIYPKGNDDGILTEVIMPETTRLVTRNISGVSQVGIYEVRETINYLGHNTVLNRIVIACPVWFMILMLLTTTAIILSVVRIVKVHRLKNKVA